MALVPIELYLDGLVVLAQRGDKLTVFCPQGVAHKPTINWGVGAAQVTPTLRDKIVSSPGGTLRIALSSPVTGSQTLPDTVLDLPAAVTDDPANPVGPASPADLTSMGKNSMLIVEVDAFHVRACGMGGLWECFPKNSSSILRHMSEGLLLALGKQDDQTPVTLSYTSSAGLQTEELGATGVGPWRLSINHADEDHNNPPRVGRDHEIGRLAAFLPPQFALKTPVLRGACPHALDAEHRLIDTLFRERHQPSIQGFTGPDCGPACKL